jgi:hypothetical protein
MSMSGSFRIVVALVGSLLLMLAATPSPLTHAAAPPSIQGFAPPDIPERRGSGQMNSSASDHAPRYGTTPPGQGGTPPEEAMRAESDPDIADPTGFLAPTVPIPPPRPR